MNEFSNRSNFSHVSLDQYGIINAKINYNLSNKDLYNICIDRNLGSITNQKVLAIKTGKFTGRSPKDRYIVCDNITEKHVWWGDVNRPLKSKVFDNLYNKMMEHFSGKELFVRDSYACAKKKNQLNIRTICEYPWSDIFCSNMFIRHEVVEESNVDWVVFCAPNFEADINSDGVSSKNFSIINFSKKMIIIGGTGYTGEIKKGIFSVLNFILPINYNILPMHCSANIGENNDTSIFFGLSGTGKTTLSTENSRKLIGDDEHGWDNENNIFNFEGGCYAKVLNLSHRSEPEIFNAIKPGALLENVILNEKKEVDFNDSSITQNSRVSYPINYIKNVKLPSIGSHPRNIFFLTADAFGVLPPISKLSSSQSAYHFISGYTSKLAGTEDGINEPIPSFSACFGAPFMPLHPTRYADMLIQKINNSNATVWLVNTGWTGGAYGIGKRMELKYTRAMIDAAMSGELEQFNKNNYHIHSVFNLMQPRTCPNVPDNVLSPRKTWNNDEKYYKMAYMLSSAFTENFKNFIDQADSKILLGAPNTK